MDAIRDKRRELGMTQEQLAQKLGVTQGAVNKWETSECCPKSSRLKAGLHCGRTAALRRRSGERRVRGIDLKRIREKRGLTQKELAERVGATQQAVSQWESGANAFSVDMLIKLAGVLDCSADEILGIKKQPERESGC